MPNPYAHLVFGKLYLKNLKTNVDLNNFYFGCVIPDINHISNLERRITHFYDGDVFEFFKPKNIFEYSFCLGHNLHIKIDNLWKYNIRLKYNIPLEENLKIYAYLDYFLKKTYNFGYNYFKERVLKGNCNFLKKLGINKKLCEEWKKRCLNDDVKHKNKNIKYEKLVKEFLNLVNIFFFDIK